MIRVLKNKSGFSAIWAVVILLAALLISAGIFEYIRLNIIAEGVRDAVQSAVVSVCNDNYGNTFPGTREGYSGGYKKSESTGSSWNIKVTKGDVYGRLDDLLGLKTSGTKHVKAGNEFMIYGLTVKVENAPFAPNNKSEKQFSITTKLTLEVPVSIMGKAFPPMIVNLQVKSRYVPKF